MVSECWPSAATIDLIPENLLTMLWIFNFFHAPIFVFHCNVLSIQFSPWNWMARNKFSNAFFSRWRVWRCLMRSKIFDNIENFVLCAKMFTLCAEFCETIKRNPIDFKTNRNTCKTLTARTTYNCDGSWQDYRTLCVNIVLVFFIFLHLIWVDLISLNDEI